MSTAKNRERPYFRNDYLLPRLHAIEEEQKDAVALCRINVRLGRMVQVRLPVPRCGRQARAAESYLKPRVVEFIRVNKKVVQNLFRTAKLKEMDLAVQGFQSSLISSEFLLKLPLQFYLDFCIKELEMIRVELKIMLPCYFFAYYFPCLLQ